MRIGFIGVGNMGTAIMKGYLAAHKDINQNINIYDKDEKKILNLSQELGVNKCNSLERLMEHSDIVILAVKPQNFEEVLTEISAFYKPHQVFVSIAAGISIGYIEQLMKHEGIKVVRVMPNIPALVNEGMSALCKNKYIPDDEFKMVVEIFRSVGRAEVLQQGGDRIYRWEGQIYYFFLFLNRLLDGSDLSLLCYRTETWRN
jgi:pyrroline-5-carboxylate reductase